MCTSTQFWEDVHPLKWEKSSVWEGLGCQGYLPWTLVQLLLSIITHVISIAAFSQYGSMIEKILCLWKVCDTVSHVQCIENQCRQAWKWCIKKTRAVSDPLRYDSLYPDVVLGVCQRQTKWQVFVFSQAFMSAVTENWSTLHLVKWSFGKNLTTFLHSAVRLYQQGGTSTGAKEHQL